MENGVIERKVWYLGSWKNNILADNVISQVVSLSRKKKGVKVRLSMSRDGLRVIRSTLLQGKMLTNFIPLVNLYFMTVNHHNPECLLVIAKDIAQKYQILAFRCANGLDAGFLIQCFKGIRKSLQSVEGFNVELKRSDGGNWTLRDKHGADDKRQLSSFVDIRTEKKVIKQNGDIHVTVDRKSAEAPKDLTDENRNVTHTVVHSRVDTSPQTTPREKVFREEVYLKGRTQHNIGVQAAGATSEQYPDNVSEISDSNQSLQNELNYLSNELREIKFMLEKSTGISAEEYHDKTDGTKIVRHEVTKTVVETSPQPKDAVVQPIDAVVIEGDDDETPKENGGPPLQVVETNHFDGEVRVSVPDYRSLGVQTVPKFVQRRSATMPVKTRESYPEDKPELLRASTSSYTSWRDDVVLRSKPSRSSRPRSAYYSTSSYHSSSNDSLKGSIRGSHEHYIYPADGSQPGSVRLRKQRVSTTVQKPIEKVYQRPHSVHGSVHHRPLSVHHHQGPVYKIAVPQNLDLNQNNMNGSVVLRHGSSTDVSPSSPRQTLIIRS